MPINRKVILIVAGMLTVGAGEAQDRRVLPNQIPKLVESGSVRSVGRYPANERMNVAIGVPLADTKALAAFIETLYNPVSPSYKKYLTPDQFTERFAASASDYQKVVDFLTSSGLTVTATTPNRMIVDVGGSVADFERVFHFTMRTYQHPTEARRFHSPDAQPLVPAGVPILDIMGLDDFELPHRMDSSAKPRANLTGSGAGGAFLAKDLRAAYAPGVTLLGVGQSIGLFELGPYSSADISAYAQANGIAGYSVTNVLVDGVNGVWSPAYSDGREALDIEMALAMAPGAQILVYEGTNPGDVMNRMATDNSARQLSVSWGFTPAPPSMQQILMEYAAQGQSFLHASGDGGAWTTAISAPGGNPYTTEVGATDLITSGPAGTWVSETAWQNSGGGFDSSFPTPSWQISVDMSVNMGSTTFRNFPDVAIVGEPSIFSIANGQSITSGGTGASSPLWAGFVALANQQASVNQNPPVGFLNPVVYALGQSTRYNQDFHDITAGNNTTSASPNLYYAVPGYDLTTGWGTPAGLSMINDLASGASATPGFSLSVAPYQVTVNIPVVNQGGSGTAVVTVNPYGGLASPLSFAISGLPSGATGTFTQSIAANQFTLTVAVAANTAPGTYPSIITGSSGATKQTIGVNVVVAPPVAADFTLAASPSVLNAYPGGTATTVVSIGLIGSITAAVALSAPGTPAGITPVFSPSSNNAPTTVTFSVGTQVSPGISVINITGTTGGVTHTTTLSLLVHAAGSSGPLAIDLSTLYNVTGISADSIPFPTGMGDCCAYSANLLGPALTTLQSIPFLFGPVSNGVAPPWNVIGGGGGSVTVPLPSGQFGSIQMVATAQGGSVEALPYKLNYTDSSSANFTQSVSDWQSPQNYPGETISSTMAYANLSSGTKLTPGVNIYSYSFGLDVCKTVQNFVLPSAANLYTMALTLTPGTPACNNTTIGSVNAVSGASTISQNAWIEIHGLNLAPVTTPAAGFTWSSAPDFAQGRMPTSLFGVSVSVGGNPAYVYYVNQTQLDVLVPLSSFTGTVPVIVTNGTTVSRSFNVTQAATSPAFALSGGTKYLAATHSNGAYIGPASAGAGFTPASPGEEIVLYGFGFGLPTTTLVPGASTQSGPLPFTPNIMIGGQAAQVIYAGVISPGLYQFNVVVPSSAASGDLAVMATYNQVAISTAGFIPVQGSN